MPPSPPYSKSVGPRLHSGCPLDSGAPGCLSPRCRVDRVCVGVYEVAVAGTEQPRRPCRDVPGAGWHVQEGRQEVSRRD